MWRLFDRMAGISHHNRRRIIGEPQTSPYHAWLVISWIATAGRHA